MISTINPATGKKIAEYALCASDEAAECIERGHSAFQQWRKVSFAQRSRLMNNLIIALENEKEQCARLISTEMGKPIRKARDEIDKCIWVCQHYMKNAQDYLEDKIVTTEHHKALVAYRPLGVILAIMPWNFPFWQVFRFFAPNLMAGNAVILKHASISSGAGQKIASLIEQAGFPSDLFQSLILDKKATADVIGHPHIAGVTLTGSGKAGQSVAETSGRHLKKVVLEMGGSDPYLVLADANIDQAADSIVKSRLTNAGQVCIAAKRALVVQSVAAELQEKIIERMQEYKPTDPLDPDTMLGPMARGDLRDTLHQQVQQSIEKGAVLLAGGKIPEGDGFYYPATLLTNVQPGMPAFDEELFGPVIAITEVADTDEAVNLANRTVYGLGASVFTRNLAEGEDIAKNRLEAGSCFVNGIVSSDPRLPFGGIRQSGFGRELGPEGIREFMNVKTVVIA